MCIITLFELNSTNDVHENMYSCKLSWNTHVDKVLNKILSGKEFYKCVAYII